VQLPESINEVALSSCSYEYTNSIVCYTACTCVLNLKQELSGGDSPHTETVPGISPSTALVTAVQQRYRGLGEQANAAMSSDASRNASTEAPQADVATDVSELYFHADVSNFINGQLMPRLKAAALEHSGGALGDVRQGLAELQGFIELADEHDCTGDSSCANVLKQSLQQIYDGNTEQLPDADVISQWLKQHSANGSRARHLLKLVSRESSFFTYCALCASILTTSAT
jgi:hypothetical protein